MKQDFRNTKIRIKSEEHSKAFQEAVFAAGGGWGCEERVVRNLHKEFLFVSEDLRLSYCDQLNFFKEHEYKEIQSLLPTKGHVHAKLIAKYAEDAKTHASKTAFMKEVDWDIAPEGATHYNTECVYPWLKETPASYFDGDGWIEYVGTSYKLASAHLKNAVKRPQEWDGVGLPPVGTVCEYLKHANYKTNWIKIKVVFIGGNLIVFEHGANGNEFSEQITEVSFRPIKTPKQIASEERQQAIDEMMDFLDYYSTTRDAMGVLYDAGYRKVEV